MAKTRDKVQNAADSVKPFVDRAMNDEQLRREVLNAFETAKSLYKDLSKSKSRGAAAAKVALDDDVRNRLREAVHDLQNASDRLQGKSPRSKGGKKGLLVAALALGVLFNPVTGPEARKWVMDIVGGGGHDDHDHAHDGSSNGGPS